MKNKTTILILTQKKRFQSKQISRRDYYEVTNK